MGNVVGKISVETRSYQVVKSEPEYEIRKYPSSVIAEFTYDPSEFKGDKDGGFSVLGNYIGALGDPQNTRPEKIAMTAPVITKESQSENIAMTAPVVTKEDNKLVTLQFVLPSKYNKVEEAPKPVDHRVEIKEEGEKKYAVVTFSGLTSELTVAEKADKLKEWLRRDGHNVVGEFSLGRYNPPWTLPMFRTNEVLIPVE